MSSKKITKLKRAIHKAPLSYYVAFSIALLIIYTITEMVVSTITNIPHDTLTTCVFSAFGGEFLMCGLIKIFKLKGEKEDE